MAYLSRDSEGRPYSRLTHWSRKAVNLRPESGPCASHTGSHGDHRRSRSPRAPSPRHVGGDPGPPGKIARCRGPRIPSVGSRPDEIRAPRRLHRRRGRRARGERVRVADGAPTAATLEGDDGRVPPLDVHGSRPSRRRCCDPDRPRRNQVGEGPRNSRHASPRVALRRTPLHATRLRTHVGDAAVSRWRSPSSSSCIPKIEPSKVATIPAVTITVSAPIAPLPKHHSTIRRPQEVDGGLLDLVQRLDAGRDISCVDLFRVVPAQGYVGLQRGCRFQDK